MTQFEIEVERVVNICDFIKTAEIEKVFNFAIQFVRNDKDATAYPLILEKLNERLDWDF